MNGKWTYIESETLAQTIAFDRNTGWLFCKDGTRYSPAELRTIASGGGDIELPLAVHVLKKTFGGEIVAKGEVAPKNKTYAFPGNLKD